MYETHQTLLPLHCTYNSYFCDILWYTVWATHTTYET